jgi:hypothetical protein
VIFQLFSHTFSKSQLITSVDVQHAGLGAASWRVANKQSGCSFFSGFKIFGWKLDFLSQLTKWPSLFSEKVFSLEI